MQNEVLITTAGLCEVRAQLPDLGAGWDYRLSPHRLPDDLRNVKVVVLGNEYLDAETLSFAPNLGLICRFGVHTDRVDHEAAHRRSIRLANCPAVSSQCVAEAAFAGLLAVLRRHDLIAADGTIGNEIVFDTLHGKSLGILGLGALGRATAVLGLGFGMSVIYWNRSPVASEESSALARADDPSVLFDKCDVVAVCLSTSPETLGFVNGRLLRCSRPEQILVNMAFREAINTADVASALRSKRIRAIVCDYLYPEFGGFGRDRVWCTSHTAARTKDSIDRKIEIVAAQIEAFRRGLPIPHEISLSLQTADKT
jgi:phosphoglycerate dehydrogenase-like enzyme